MCNRFVIFRDIFERQVLVDSSNILDLVEGLTISTIWFLAWGDGRLNLQNIYRFAVVNRPIFVGLMDSLRGC
jgi:hypothetical protein